MALGVECSRPTNLRGRALVDTTLAEQLRSSAPVDHHKVRIRAGGLLEDLTEVVEVLAVWIWMGPSEVCMDHVEDLNRARWRTDVRELPRTLLACG